MLYPITVDVMRQVFSPYGLVEKLDIIPKSLGFQFRIQFQTQLCAATARASLQGRNIYDDCCQLDVQFATLGATSDCADHAEYKRILRGKRWIVDSGVRRVTQLFDYGPHSHKLGEYVGELNHCASGLNSGHGSSEEVSFFTCGFKQPAQLGRNISSNKESENWQMREVPSEYLTSTKTAINQEERQFDPSMYSQLKRGAGAAGYNCITHLFGCEIQPSKPLNSQNQRVLKTVGRTGEYSDKCDHHYGLRVWCIWDPGQVKMFMGFRQKRNFWSDIVMVQRGEPELRKECRLNSYGRNRMWNPGDDQKMKLVTQNQLEILASEMRFVSQRILWLEIVSKEYKKQTSLAVNQSLRVQEWDIIRRNEETLWVAIVDYASNKTHRSFDPGGVVMQGPEVEDEQIDSLLFSAFEFWLRGFKQQWLTVTYFIAGRFGNFLVAPYDAAACLLATDMAVIISSWPGNEGDPSENKDLLTQFKNAPSVIAYDENIALLGAIQSPFEGSRLASMMDSWSKLMELFLNGRVGPDSGNRKGHGEKVRDTITKLVFYKIEVPIDKEQIRGTSLSLETDSITALDTEFGVPWECVKYREWNKSCECHNDVVRISLIERQTSHEDVTFTAVNRLHFYKLAPQLESAFEEDIESENSWFKETGKWQDRDRYNSAPWLDYPTELQLVTITIDYFTYELFQSPRPPESELHRGSTPGREYTGSSSEQFSDEP